MSFVFPILLGGLVLAGIPVLLHLILRQKPKTLPFPAFRFLVQKHRSNLRKLQLRHILLLALRIILIAALCLALAGPKLLHESLGLSRERPVAAILVFDTSPSMDYLSSDQQSRLDEAKQRGLELLAELPEGSRVVVLDTAEAALSDKADWLPTTHQVRQRIEKLKIQPVNAPVARSIEQAARLFLTAARSDDAGLRSLSRLLCVFSDRTLASWPGSSRAPLDDVLDQLPATSEGVHQFRAGAAPLSDLLKELRGKLPPPAAKDYPEQALLESIAALRDRSASLEPESLYRDDSLLQLIGKTRRQTRALREALAQLGEQQPADLEAFRAKTLTALNALQRSLAGAHFLYLDVGMDQPVDVALLQLGFPLQADGAMQQLFAADDKVILRAELQALGREISTAVQCKIGKEIVTKQVDLKAGERQTVPLELDLNKLGLGVGPHALQVSLTGKDALAWNNQLFSTLQVRQPKKVLVLTDAKEKAAFFERALRVVGYASEIKTVDASPSFDSYHAVYLFEVAQPSAALWQNLSAYVQKGGSVAIVPGREEMNAAAYQTPPALAIMPGAFKEVMALNPSALWNLDDSGAVQHPMLKPFRAWFDNPRTDFVARPRWAHRFWLMTPDPKQAVVVLRYSTKDDPPALMERTLPGSAGKVIVFTTPIDDLAPSWNNYHADLTSFPVALALMTARYLTGEDRGRSLNFQCGLDEPRLPLPPAPRFPTYTLRGRELIETLSVDAEVNELRIKLPLPPDNYEVVGNPGPNATNVGRFSVNLPTDEGDLTRVPAADIEAVFGEGVVVATERQASIQELLQGQWNEPLELFPYLMILLLLVLAVENLLANKFYRRDDVS